MWGCKAHWFTLPKQLRDLVWLHYKPGQEITKTPSEAYLATAELVQAWISKDKPRGDAAIKRLEVAP